jgi:hypothetical protein
LITAGAQIVRWWGSTHAGRAGMASPRRPAVDDSDELVKRGTQ